MMSARLVENVPGRYYVNARCIGCTICPEIAPANFASNLEEGYEYVCKQPKDRDEEALCREAMEICPVDAIRNNGLKPEIRVSECSQGEHRKSEKQNTRFSN